MNQYAFINEYYSLTDREKVKKLGQYFTPQQVALYMVQWVTANKPKRVLDPAIGNNIFLDNIERKDAYFQGYDVDKHIVDFFNAKSPYNLNVIIEDYLLSGWDEKWDSIVANPPYNRFQNIDNKEEIRKLFKEKLCLDVPGYSNQYALFLLKSLFELNDGGRLAYIIPTEFMNLDYGDILRRQLCNNGYLTKIIMFNTKENKSTLFDSAITTSCIVLVEKKHHDFVSFCEASISLDGSLEIKEIKSVSTTDLLKEDNWKRLISDKNYEIVNLVSFDKFIKVSRGIATGDNEYFLFNEEKRIKNNLSMEHFYQVICKAPYINKPFFTSTELEIIKKQNKDYLLFDGTLCSDDANAKYLEFGLNSGILDKYLVASRKVWYESEQKPIAPIWICGNSREKIKVVRNELGVRNLTTFHGVFVKKEYTKFIDVIFCYLLSNTSQRLLEMNKKEYAGGLNKFQPGDIQKSFTIDFEKMSNDDISLIKNCYNMMKRTNSISEEILLQLNLVFDRYL